MGSDNEDVIGPADAQDNPIRIFDVACNEQNKIREYFLLFRHKWINAVYFWQTFLKITKQLARDNDVIELFKQNDMILKHAYDEHVSPNITYEEFKKLCSTC